MCGICRTVKSQKASTTLQQKNEKHILWKYKIAMVLFKRPVGMVPF